MIGSAVNKEAVSSIKSMIGYLLGAVGSVESIFRVLAIPDQVALSAISLDNPDAGCDINLVSDTPQQCKINAVLTNSFDFGGTYGSLIFRKLA